MILNFYKFIIMFFYNKEILKIKKGNVIIKTNNKIKRGKALKTQKRLSKLGIESIRELDYKEINYIAHFATEQITTTFPIVQNQYNKILAKILNCKMYYSKITSNISKVNYIYWNNSIYIDENIKSIETNEQLIHEIIHYLQVLRKNNGKIQKIGFCEFNDFKLNRLGLNEAIVQYMSSKIMKREKNDIKIYGINLKTISPNSYPLITNLIEQIIYLIGEDIIVKSALNIDINENEFENTLYCAFEEKTDYIIKNFDRLLEIKNKLFADKQKGNIKIDFENKIANTYLNTQNAILSEYYNQIIPKAKTQEEIDFYYNKYIQNKEYIGIVENNEKVDFYEDYKTIIQSKLDKQLIKINKEKQKNALIKYNNKLIEFFKRTISYLIN